jgi:membrane protein
LQRYAIRRSWHVIKDTAYGFVADDALSRGAAIAFYTATSLAPVLLIVIAIAGLVFGQDAAQNAITGQLSGLVGDQTAQLLQTAVASASKKSSGALATLVGLLTLILTASGVFGEMQSALNAIWKAEPSGTAITRLIRARAVSLGLVAALGFLLLVSLAVNAMLTAFGNQLNAVLPFGKLILSAINLVISLVLITVLFAAIYKILPDRPLAWEDVMLGAVITTYSSPPESRSSPSTSEAAPPSRATALLARLSHFFCGSIISLKYFFWARNLQERRYFVLRAAGLRSELLYFPSSISSATRRASGSEEQPGRFRRTARRDFTHQKFGALAMRAVAKDIQQQRRTGARGGRGLSNHPTLVSFSTFNSRGQKRSRPRASMKVLTSEAFVNNTQPSSRCSARPVFSNSS